DDAQRGLDAAGPHHTTVKDEGGVSAVRRQAPLQQQVADVFLVTGELEDRAATDQRRVEAGFDFSLPLRAQRLRAPGALDNHAVDAGYHAAEEAGELLAIERLVTGLTIRCSYFHLAQSAIAEVQAIGRRALGIVEELGRVGVITAPVGAEAGSKQ